MARLACSGFLAAALVLSAGAGPVHGARSSQQLLPAATKAYLSVPDVDALKEKFGQTQIGQLVSDPVMAPFVEDLRRQMKEKLSDMGVRLGLTWEDLKDASGGEVALAMIQPGGDKTRHALVLLVDVTDHLPAARALLDQISKNLQEKGAERTTREADGVEMTVFTLPQSAEAPETRRAFYFIEQNWLVASDQEETAAGVLARLRGAPGDRLEQLPAFAATMRRCREAFGAMQPHIRWFIEPFGYAEVLQAARGGAKRRGADLVQILSDQGFRAIQGVGGYIALATGEYDVRHATMIYAPRADGADEAPNSSKYAGAARMLDFPNHPDLSPPRWIPRELTAYATFYWKTKEAFEYSKPLVNAVVGDEVFEDVLAGIRDDPLGPQVDLRKELVAYFGQRITVMSDFRAPATPTSDRLLVAVQVTDPDAVARTINKAMESDPDAKKHEFQGRVIWEIMNEPEEVVELKLEGPGFGPFLQEEEPPEEEAFEPLFSNPAIAVADGQLFFASQIDLIEKVLKPRDPRDTLAESCDFQLVSDALQKLGAGSDCLHSFTRMDEALHGTYELIRQGKMPESESLLGKLLNRLLGPDEEGVLRQQEINGAKLPEYQVARRYLGPSGTFVRSVEDGWFAAGCVLAKPAE